MYNKKISLYSVEKAIESFTEVSRINMASF